jgi:hypothetical protein
MKPGRFVVCALLLAPHLAGATITRVQMVGTAKNDDTGSIRPSR